MDLLDRILKERFGFTTFRTGQKEAIELLLRSHKLLCIQKTGHGKSLLYQLPSCILEGMTLVISPLLALMRDQVFQLNQRFGIASGSMSSDQTVEEHRCTREVASQGGLKILFVSPEQIDHVDRAQFFLALPISLVVVDEAHCISMWGHDFRPSYRQILPFVKQLEENRKELRVLALTATADRRIEKDIQEQLCFRGETTASLREAMDKPSLQLFVVKIHSMQEKLGVIEGILRENGAVLIYCATRENVELVAEYFARKGIELAAYHAGLDPQMKREIESAFLSDRYKGIVATNALGMGIDKPNIRILVHFDIPGSITAYYQEVGRAGRDGLSAKGILLYDPKDEKIQEYFIESSFLMQNDFEKVQSLTQPLGLNAIKQETGLHPVKVALIMSILVEQAFFVKESVKGVQVYKKTHLLGSPDLQEQEIQRDVRYSELAKMRVYARGDIPCRMLYLRNMLGDEEDARCGSCDLCRRWTFVSPTAEQVQEIETWLTQRPIPIPARPKSHLEEGLSLIDGRLRSDRFIRFMQGRQQEGCIDQQLIAWLKERLSMKSFEAIVVLPSNTWKLREAYGEALGEALGIPCFTNILAWRDLPKKRQGELLNYEQRRFNVEGKMEVRDIPFFSKTNLLLFDDYIGSGSTMKEAARALRIHFGKGVRLTPCTIAVLHWRQGKPGFI